MRWVPQIISNENGAVAQMVRDNIAAGNTVRNYDVAVGMVRQNCFDGNELLDMNLIMVSANGRPFWTLMYSLLICIVI